ncbi:MAG: hypothetical protein QM770_01265 [Tepidisphaeraceae bacterium]
MNELLFDPRQGPAPLLPTLLAAQSHLKNRHTRSLVWCDPHGTIHAPVLNAMGVAVDRCYLLRPRPGQLLEVVADCLRCPGVGAVVAMLPARLSRVEARRLQLAAERGGGLGLMVRPLGAGSDIYAAARRWLVEPAPGELGIQRWRVQLVHGHGRLLGQSFHLECRRDAADASKPVLVPVRSPSTLAHRPMPAPAARSSA